MDGKWCLMFTEETPYGGGTCLMTQRIIPLETSINKEEAIVEAKTKLKELATKWEKEKKEGKYEEDDNFQDFFYDFSIASSFQV